MEGVVTLIVECVFAVVEYPGAALHWAMRNGKVPFDVLVSRWFGINLLLSLLLYGLITWLVVVLCY